MGVLAVYRLIEETGGQGPEGYLFDINFRVSTDGPTDVINVLEASGIPRKGDQHPSGRATCSNVEATNGGDLWWDVVATYDEEDNTPDGGGGGDPEAGDTRPTLNISGRGRQIARNSDVLGNAILNSATDPFEADIFDDASTVITITANVSFGTVSLTKIERWRGVVHAGPMQAHIVQDPAPENVLAGGPAAFFGYGGGVVRCVDAGAAMDHSGTATRWNLHLQFEVAQSWLGTALDMGVHSTKNPALPKTYSSLNLAVLEERKPILDHNGVPVTRPVLLNGEGKPLEQGGQPWYIVWQRYRHDDLNAMLSDFGLPTSLNGYRK